MSAAEQENSHKQAQQGGAFSSGHAGTGAGLSSDASFDRLLEQLEAEEGRPTGGGVSQIFAPEPGPAEPGPRVEAGATPPRSAAPAGQAAAAGPQTARRAEPAPAVAATTPAQEPAGEFTRIFTQLPTPRSAPPAILAEVAAPLPTPAVVSSVAAPVVSAEVASPPPAASTVPGEFTQFFRALDASPGTSGASALSPTPAGREARTFEPQKMASPIPAAPVPDGMVADLLTPTATPAPVAPVAQTFEPARVAQAPLAPGERSVPPAFAPAASDAPPAFAATSVAVSPAFAPAALTPIEPAPAPSAPQTAEPGAFTAFFQAAAASAAPAREAAPVEVAPIKAAPSTPAGRTVGEPDYSAGFAGPTKNSGASGGFTELLHSLGSESGSFSPSTGPAFSSSSSAAAGPYADAFSPVASPPPQAARTRESAFTLPFSAQADQKASASGARPGEFTELMQSLQAANAKPVAPSAPAAQAPFFGGAPVSSGGPSEFTRIMQGSAARSAEVPAANFAPAPQSSGAAVGLPIAVPQAPMPPVAEAKTKLQAMLPWLLAANGALLLLLIALAFLLLRHKH